MLPHMGVSARQVVGTISGQGWWLLAGRAVSSLLAPSPAQQPVASQEELFWAG